MQAKGKTSTHVTIEWGALSPTFETLGFREKAKRAPRRAKQSDAYAALCMILRENGSYGFKTSSDPRFA